MIINGLLVVLIGLVVNDVEELELVDTLGGGDDAEPITELHLLEELLGPAPTLSVFLFGATSRFECESYRYLR